MTTLSAPSPSAYAPSHELLTPMLDELIAAIEKAAVRVRGGVVAELARVERSAEAEASGDAQAKAEVDAEAVHDFRVALRRLRTLLRPAGPVYGKRRLHKAARALRRFAGAAGSVRDEEVLRETLGAIVLSPEARQDLDAWIAARALIERSSRDNLTRLLGEHEGRRRSLDAALTRLMRLLHHPRVYRRRAPLLGELAERALRKAIEGVQKCDGVQPADVERMHELRIRYKHLRYTAELFGEVLGEKAAAIEKLSVKLQRRLGDLHDADEAIARVAQVSMLSPVTRNAAIAALRARRDALAERAAREHAEAAPTLASGLPSRLASEFTPAS